MAGSDIYCGGKTVVPKAKKRGSMKECVDKKQISYYGVKKVDSKLMNTYNEVKKKVSMAPVLAKIGTMRGRIKKYTLLLNKKITDAVRKGYEEQLEKCKKELTIALKKFNDYNDKKQGRTISKKSKKSKKSKISRKSKKNCTVTKSKKC